ncbi:MAG: hypothetical protein QM756_15670 [Polyangiaceae bacterium]
MRFPPNDQNDLNTLAICHYAYAAMMALGGLIPLGVVMFGVGLLTSITALHSRQVGGVFLGGAFMIIMGALAALLWVKAALVAYSGYSLKQGRHRTLGQVVAVICCFNMPFGTLLGAFTLVVLNRPAVRAGFEGA